MADYSEDIKFTADIIDEFGDDVIIRRNSSNLLIDQNKPWLGNTITNIDYTQKGVMFGIDNKFSGDDLLRNGDRYCLIASSTISITPNPKDKLINAGVEFEIIRVVSIEPANQQILFKIYCRGQANDS